MFQVLSFDGGIKHLRNQNAIVSRGGISSVELVEMKAVKNTRVDEIQIEPNIGILIDELSEFDQIFVADRIAKDMDVKCAIGIVDQQRRKHDTERRHKILVDAEGNMKCLGSIHMSERLELSDIISRPSV